MYDVEYIAEKADKVHVLCFLVDQGTWIKSC